MILGIYANSKSAYYLMLYPVPFLKDGKFFENPVVLGTGTFLVVNYFPLKLIILIIGGNIFQHLACGSNEAAPGSLYRDKDVYEGAKTLCERKLCQSKPEVLMITNHVKTEILKESRRVSVGSEGGEKHSDQLKQPETVTGPALEQVRQSRLNSYLISCPLQLMFVLVDEE